MQDKTPKSKLQAFYMLQAAVCEDLPPDAVTTAVRAGKIDNATRGKNVVQSLTKDLGMLVNIVEAALPLYQVPAEIKKFA